MVYNFLANKSDKMNVLNHIFENTDLQLFDSYSEYGQETCRYRSASEIATKFDLANGGQFAVTLQMWSPRFGVEIAFSRTKLNPRYCDGHTFRYSTSGWGRIQLYLGGCEKNCLHHSHIGHFNERGAIGRVDNDRELAEVKRWNWKQIALTSGRLRRQISKMSVRKFDGLDALPGADALDKSGVELRY